MDSVLIPEKKKKEEIVSPPTVIVEWCLMPPIYRTRLHQAALYLIPFTPE